MAEPLHITHHPASDPVVELHGLWRAASSRRDAANAAHDALLARDPSHPDLAGLYADCNDTFGEVCELVERVIELPAQTTAGVVAKLRVAASMYSGMVEADLNESERLAVVALRDAEGFLSRTLAHPDAGLIAACAEFAGLNRKMDALNSAVLTGDDRDRADAEVDRLQSLQYVVADRIVALRATTFEGVQTRARTLAAWADDLITDSAESGFADKRIMAAVLRDLVSL